MQLRVLSADDWRLFREIRLAALAGDPAAFGTQLAAWQGDGDREARWRARLDVAGSRNFAAIVDERPAGIASGFPGSAPDVRELISMWVAPWARGRGAGDALVEAVLAWARQDGARAVELSVVVGNAFASALYARHGFEPTGEVIREADRLEARVLCVLAGERQSAPRVG